MDTNQHKFESRIEAKLDMSSSVLEQLLKDQQLLAKQMEITGQAVAHLTLNQAKQQEPPPSPTYTEAFGSHGFGNRRQKVEEPSNYQRTSNTTQRDNQQGKHHKGGFMPKMSCPRFDGNNPCIWKAKCQDYFHLLDIPESMWTTAASLHMDGNAEKWMQVYKMKNGLGDWE